MKTNTSNKTNINNTLKNRKENKTMKTTMKMILTVVLALTLVCALGAPAFADFMSPYGYVSVNYDGSRTLYLGDGSTVTLYPDGSMISYDAATGETTYSSDRVSATTFYQDGSTYYENGNGYSEYHDAYGDGYTDYADGSYTVEENGMLYHYDAYGNLMGVQYFNGSYYENIF